MAAIISNIVPSFTSEMAEEAFRCALSMRLTENVVSFIKNYPSDIVNALELTFSYSMREDENYYHQVAQILVVYLTAHPEEAKKNIAKLQILSEVASLIGDQNVRHLLLSMLETQRIFTGGRVTCIEVGNSRHSEEDYEDEDDSHVITDSAFAEYVWSMISDRIQNH